MAFLEELENDRSIIPARTCCRSAVLAHYAAVGGLIGIVLANLRRPEAGQQIYGGHLDPVRQTEARTGSSEPAAHELIVSGITARSAAPRAGQIPYADHIFALELSDLEVDKGTLAEPKIAVYLFSMRNQQNTPAFVWPRGVAVVMASIAPGPTYCSARPVQPSTGDTQPPDMPAMRR